MKNIFLFLASILLLSCKNKSAVIIDNPSQEMISISIDDTEYSVAPGMSQVTALPFGKHILITSGKKETIDFEPGKDYLLNPTHSVYVMKEFFFLDSNATTKEALSKSEAIAKLKSDSFLLGNYRIYGNVKKDSSLIIEKKWDFAPNEKLPSEVEQTVNISSKIKIYRAEEFLKEEVK